MAKDGKSQSSGAMRPRAAPPDSPADLALRAEVIDKLYGVALDPATLPDLITAWEDLLAPHWRDAPDRVQQMLERTGIARHIDQADQMLIQSQEGQTHRAEELALMPYRRTVAFIIDGRLRIAAANQGARDRLRVAPGNALSALPLRSDDIAQMSNTALELFRTERTDPVLLRARRPGTDRPIIISLTLSHADAGQRFIVAATTELHWTPEAMTRLRGLLDLSPTEGEVLSALAEDLSLAEIAHRRGRSVETIRTQVKSLMAKTETKSQTDLMRLALTTMSLAPSSPASMDANDRPTRVARAGLELSELPFHTLIRQTGGHSRGMDYLEFGAPNGRPVVYFCSNFGLCRWPAAAEFAAHQTDMRVIVPIRPGFGWSDPLPRGADRVEEVAQDILSLLDHLGIAAAHLLVLDEDMIFATRMHRLAPARVLGVLGCSSSLPFIRAEQYDRMGRWHRFALGTARFTPQFLTYAVRAGFAMARHLGKAGFVRRVYAASASDVAITQQPRVFDAIDCGSDIVLGDGIDATRAYAEEIGLFHGTDWAEDFRAMCADIRVVVLLGEEDQSIPRQTRIEFAVDYPKAEIEVVANAGSFLLFQQWITVLQRLEDLLGNTKG